MYQCVCVCIYMYIYMCIYIYIYTHTHTHTHTHTQLNIFHYLKICENSVTTVSSALIEKFSLISNTRTV